MDTGDTADTENDNKSDGSRESNGASPIPAEEDGAQTADTPSPTAGALGSSGSRESNQESPTPTEEGGAKMGDSPSPITGAFIQSPKPRTWYNIFLGYLKDDSCSEVVNAISRFIGSFPKVVASRTQAAVQIHSFLSQMEVLLFQTEHFRNATEKDQNHGKEGLEKFLMSKLYPTLFASEDNDVQEDANIDRSIRRLCWLTFHHLDMPPIPETDTLDLAAQELKKINRIKAPGEKLVLIINCFRVIVSILEHTGKTANTKPSADDILPLLILVLIKANPPNLHSNLEYIGSMRHPNRFVGEDLYAYTQLLSAVSFIRQVSKDASKLNVSQEEFDRLTREAVSSGDEAEPTETTDKRLNPADRKYVSKSRLDYLVANLDDLSISFDGLENVRHLRLADIEDLFSEYQSLCVSLRSTKNALKHMQQGGG